jgi:hypothetical protein
VTLALIEILGFQNLISSFWYMVDSDFYKIKDNDLYLTNLFERRNWFNLDVINENNSISKDLSLFSENFFPVEIPILAFVSKVSIDVDKNWLELHQNQIKNSYNQKLVILPGQHYLHMDNSEEMVSEIYKFIDSF